jgi:hypothetical protein
MRILISSFLLWAMVFSPVQAPKAQTSGPVMLSPRPGEAVQGVVTITGTSDSPGFVTSEVSFAYSDDPTGTWFLIASNSQAVTESTLTIWDTTVITDGNYVLRLRVILADGRFQDVFVTDLRVRNYTPVETPTPTAIIPEATPLPTITMTPLPFPTPTELPPNPATLAPKDVSVSVLYGGLAAIAALLIFGLYTWMRRK